MRLNTTARLWRPMLKIDVDEPRIPHEFFVRCRALLGCLPDDAVAAGALFRLRRFRSTHHWHVIIESDCVRLTRAETVALQAILGSHWRREAFNLLRAITVSDAPQAWSKRWNVLYLPQPNAGVDHARPGELQRSGSSDP
jgi:hypothetical protein